MPDYTMRNPALVPGERNDGWAEGKSLYDWLMHRVPELIAIRHGVTTQEDRKIASNKISEFLAEAYDQESVELRVLTKSEKTIFGEWDPVPKRVLEGVIRQLNLFKGTNSYHFRSKEVRLFKKFPSDSGKVILGEVPKSLPKGKSGREAEKNWWQLCRLVIQVADLDGLPDSRTKLKELVYQLMADANFKASDSMVDLFVQYINWRGDRSLPSRSIPPDN